MDINATTITLAILIIGQIVGIVVAIRKPNEKQDVSLGKFETRLGLLSEDMTLIKQNHLPHIEKEMRNMSNEMTEIRTILNERLPHKQ